MNLYILRHGLAVEPGSIRHLPDADRPLTLEGRRKLKKIVKAMANLELSFDCILSSPYVRARQTAEDVAGFLELEHRVELTDVLTPAGTHKKLIEEILERDPAPSNVLLVGHEPYLSELISLLISGDTDISVVMKKAGLCKLTVDSLRASQCATLEWLLTPKQMCLMS